MARRSKGHPEVHPHSRGENTESMGLDKRPAGSSPLARGKWLASSVRCRRRGFIPTRAGKIWVVSTTRLPHSVHPHSRGENKSLRTVGFAFRGSSPLARGKSPSRPCPPSTVRFIPTRAGKIYFSGNPDAYEAVHPHSRGENAMARPRSEIA